MPNKIATGYVNMEVEILTWPDDEVENLWVGWCPLLDIFSQGEGENEAHDAIIEAVKAYSRCVVSRRKRNANKE